MEAAEIKKKLHGHFGELLKKAKTMRTALQSVGIAIPFLVAICKGIESYTLDGAKVAAIVAQLILLLFGALIAALILFTDKSALTLMADAQLATDVLEQTVEALKEKEQIISNIESDLVRTETLRLTVESMRIAVDVGLQDSPPAVAAQVRDMLDLLVVSKEQLFGMGDEQWTFSVYTLNPASGELDCLACRRPARADEDRNHRSWKPGEGHIGQAFGMKRALIVTDSKDPNVKGFFDAPDHKKIPEYDDNERYRSLAAIPFNLPGSNDPIGVVVASSNLAGRFNPTVNGNEDDAVRPISALSKTLATLMGVINIRSKKEMANDGA